MEQNVPFSLELLYLKKITIISTCSTLISANSVIVKESET